MKIILDAADFIDDKQDCWEEDGYGHLEFKVEEWLEKHNFEDYEIDVSSVNIEAYTRPSSWSDPGESFLTVEGKVEVEVK